MRCWMHALAGLPLALGASAGGARAAEMAAPITQDILVVGQRDRAIAIAPRGLSVSLGAEQFAGVNAVNVEDLGKFAPDFFVRSRFAGDNNAVPGIRGTHSTQSARTLVLVDGFVISDFLGNSYNFPPKWGIVSPHDVAQFDIVYGPYSARHGGNSMGGIVSLTTRAPERTGAFIDLQALYQPYAQFGSHYDLWGQSAEAGFAIRPRASDWSLSVSGRRLQNDSQPMQYYQAGYSAALTDQPDAGTPVAGAVSSADVAPIASGLKLPVIGDYSPTSTRQDQLRLALRHEGTVRAELLFAYWWNREKTLEPATYLRDAGGAPFYGDATGIISTGGHSYTLDPASNYRQGVAYRNLYMLGGRIEAPVLGFDVSLNLSMLRFARQDNYQSNGFAAGLANAAGQYTHQGPTGWYSGNFTASRNFGRHALSIGADASLYETDQSIFATDHWRQAEGMRLRTRTFGRNSNIGAFIEDAIELGAATRLTAGLRYDRWRAYDGGITAIATSGALAGQPVSQYYAARTAQAWSPKLSLRQSFGSDWTAELSLATATRFPTVGELFQGSLNGDGSFNLNSFDPNLKPEKSHDANLLLRHRIGDVTLTASAFYQQVRDSIFAFTGFNQNGVLTSSFKNIDKTRQTGLELIAEARSWPVAGLDSDVNLAWINARTIRNAADPASEGVQFPRIPRWRLNANLRYRVTPKLQAVAGLRYASRPNSDLDGLQRGSGYGYTSEIFAIDLRANLDVTDNLRLSAGVDNLTNHRAWVYHPYPQRSFLLQAGVRL